MGWLGKIISKVKNTKYADVMTGQVPIFSQFGRDIYVSDVVQQAIECIANEMSKLEPCFIRGVGNDYQTPENDVYQIQNLLDNPNPIMTKSEFIEKLTYGLYLRQNAFAVPVYEVVKRSDGSSYKRYSAIYPVDPLITTFLETPTGDLIVEFEFENGYKTQLAYSDVIHIRINYFANDYMGGDASGNPDRRALLKTLQLNEDIMQGISGAVKSSFAINGVVKTQTFMSEEKAEKSIKEFERKLNNAENGILHLDAKSDYAKITRDIKLVDPDTIRFIDEKILRTFGVPLSILTGDYTKEQYEAFYQKTIEKLVGRYQEAFTKALCTPNMRARSLKIAFFTHELIFMSIEQKVEMVKYLGDTGTLYENEKRVAFGLRPMKELEGVRKQSLNYIDTDIAVEYQLAKAKGGNQDEQENE